MRAEITVSSEFVNGHIDLYLSSYDLDSWTAVLDTVESGQTASWLESGRSPRITISPAAISESECTEVSVHDVTASQIHVTVPIAAPSDWIERHRDLLDAVKRRFPSRRTRCRGGPEPAPTHYRPVGVFFTTFISFVPLLPIAIKVVWYGTNSGPWYCGTAR